MSTTVCEIASVLGADCIGHVLYHKFNMPIAVSSWAIDEAVQLGEYETHVFVSGERMV